MTFSTETWLSPGIGDDKIVPPACSIFRKDKKGRGGGVALLMKRCLNCPEISGTQGVVNARSKIKFAHLKIFPGVV